MEKYVFEFYAEKKGNYHGCKITFDDYFPDYKHDKFDFFRA